MTDMSAWSASSATDAMDVDHSCIPLAPSIPVIDSHMYLLVSDFDVLGIGIGQYDVLREEYSVDKYCDAIAQQAGGNVIGFIVMEPNRPACIMGPHKECAGWDGPLKDVSFFSRVALGTPLSSGQGHTAKDANLCLGIVPWVPLPGGKDTVKQYLKLAKKNAGDAWSRVKGFSYVLEFKEAGKASSCHSVEALEYLGRKGYPLDVQIDIRQDGCKHGKDIINLLYKLYGGLPVHWGCGHGGTQGRSLCHNGQATIPQPGTEPKATIIIGQ